MGLFTKSKNKSEEHHIINACYHGDIECVKNYISSGKNLNITEKRNSPLLVAISQHHEDVVKLLLENGADVNFNPDNTSTALHEAIDGAIYQTFYGGIEYEDPPTAIIELLIKHGADINMKNKLGVTPLEATRHYKTSSGATPQNIIDLLEKHGAH